MNYVLEFLGACTLGIGIGAIIGYVIKTMGECVRFVKKMNKIMKNSKED